MRLPYQLDWRLDTVLDNHGYHIISITSGGQSAPVDYESWPEPVVRGQAMLKFHGVADAFEMPLDLRLRDYVTLSPAGRDEGSGAPTPVRTPVALRPQDLTRDAETPESDDVVRARIAAAGTSPAISPTMSPTGSPRPGERVDQRRSGVPDPGAGVTG